jgi:6-phosphogluconolactonase
VDNELDWYGEIMSTITKYKSNIEIISDAEALAHKTVAIFVSDAEKAIEAKDVFRVAISGGHSPKRFFELLAETQDSQSLPWEKIHLFWVDERYVSPDSQWSNYKLAVDSFLAKVAIPEENIHRIPTEYDDFQEAAHNYEQTVREVFDLRADQLLIFDQIVLGMGLDGHVGSLFPNSYAPFDTEDLACVVYVLDKKLNRITLTHPVLRAAAHLLVMVSGKEKADILKVIMTSEPDEVQYPIHTLWPVLDKVTWLIDNDAAKLLEF